MIKVYGMPSCPDCSYVDEQIKDNDGFEIVDIGSNVRLMKEFTRLRDKEKAFDEVKQNGSIGIPCFVKEDGSVTLIPEEVGLKSRPADGAACSLDGKGC